MWTAVDKAWTAGLLDGEGWIGVTRTRCNARVGRFRYRAGISVSQTDPLVVDTFRRLLGGLGHRFVQDRGKPNKLTHGLHVFKKDDVVAVLEAVLPYLVTKADQALDVLAFRQLMDDKEIGGPARDLRAAALFEALRKAKADIPRGIPRPIGPPGDRPDAAWLAALVDGEGHIGIERQHHKRYNRTTHILTLTIVNTDEQLVRRIHAVARHGNINVKAFDSSNRKPIWRWRASCDNAVKILERIGPYLIRKKPHLAVVRRFDHTIHRGPNRWSPVLESELRIREECYEEFRRLNKPGRT